MAVASKSTQRLGKLLEGIDIAMLTTVGPEGYLVSRPLSTQEATFDGRRVWFFTQADSPKVAEIRRNPKVNLAYASKDKNTYVSLSGKARINKDPELRDVFWNDALKAFFPKGRNDPKLVLLEVEPRTVEYWDGPGSFLGKAISFVVARVTKREEVMGENRLVDLRSRPARTRLPPSHADARKPAKRATTARKPAKKAPTARKPAARKKSR
jgi:general stress protein 26